MRPITLMISAFGPYAGVQTVDFREATDAGLFGIYGPTGSGKSSIFSAMTLALFGRAAKEEQPINSLRSDHAPAECLTEVALVFELRPKRYLVRRQPDQLRPKARGEGETSHSHCAWLFDITDVDVDTIDFEGCGTVLAEKKVSLVNAAVRDLLGYGVEQFRQIVLLPQGRFEKFLTSDSNDRLQILRDLFDVSLYRALTEQLKEAAMVARREVSDGFRLHGQRLQAEGFASSDELETGIADSGSEYAQLEAVAAELDIARSGAEQQVTNAEALESRFQDAEATEKAAAALRAKATEVAALRLRRDNAVRAGGATDVHAAIGTALVREAETGEQQLDAERTATAAALAFDEASKSWADEKARESEIEKAQAKAGDLDRYRAILISAADLKETHSAAVTLMGKTAVKARDAGAKRDQLDASLAEHENRLASGRKDDLERSRRQAERADIAAVLERARAFQQTTNQFAAAQSSFDQLSLDLAGARETQSAAKAEAARGEAAFIAAQARILAASLADGEPSRSAVRMGEDPEEPAQGFSCT